MLDYVQIDSFSIAPKSGIIIKGKTRDFNTYFVQPEKGAEFSASLENVGIKIEGITTIPSDRHEKSLLIEGIAGFIVIAALFTNCTHNAITRPQSTSPGTKTEETVACLSKYIRGDTVDKREIEEAYRKCPP